MALYVVIGLILASLILAFFSARTWHWGHVIVVVCLMLTTFGFILLAAETLRINRVYREAIVRKTNELEDVTARNKALAKGTSDPSIIAQLQAEQEPAIAIPENAESIPSLEELDHQILLATRLRGRVWRNASPAGVDQNGVKVNFKGPAGIHPDTVVYVFEEGPAQLPTNDGKPQGKQFLGEFRVKESAGQQATLVPTHSLDQFELQRLSTSRGPWVVYETMPVDRHEIFAEMSDEELKKRLPAQSVEEYLRHGKAATKDDEDARKRGLDEAGNPLPPEEMANAAKVVYQRRLRDYAAEFDELKRRRVATEVATAEVKADIERLTVALDTAKQLQASREKEIERLKSDLAGIQKERAAINQHLAQIQKQLARGRSLLDTLLQRNVQLARELAEVQTRSSDRSTAPRAASRPAVPLALDSSN